MPDVLILGAGVAGLACAGALVARGETVVVLDKGRGVGGRVATRRVEGQPVDHGLAFFHGADPAFLAALDAVPGRVEGWPRRVAGHGPPCNSRAFNSRFAVRRLAFSDGASVFPKALAAGLDVRLGVQVKTVTKEQNCLRLEDTAGQTWRAPVLVLAVPVEQAIALLADEAEFSGARALLGTAGSSPCHTVIAAYDGPDDPLDAELFLPEDSTVLQLISHDSSKRSQPRRRVLVLQSRAAWSAARLDLPASDIITALLGEAARLLGPWAAHPSLTQHHRWRFARSGAVGFGAPYFSRLPCGATLGLCGETFHPAGGVEGAFLAGRALAGLLGAEHA